MKNSKLIINAIKKPLVMFLLGMSFALFLVSNISPAQNLPNYSFPTLENSVFSITTNQKEEFENNIRTEINNNLINDDVIMKSSIQTPKQNLNDKEIPSPTNYFNEKQILVYKDKVVLDAKNVLWASFTDTKSMLPVLNKDSNALQIIPNCPEDIAIGDIVSYKSVYADGIIIHRVVHIDFDEEGIYFVLKGDNNPSSDPGRVRCSQIDRKVIAIIY